MDLDLMYSPSRWVQRCGADEVIKKHVSFMDATSKEAKLKFDTKKIELSSDSPEVYFTVFSEKGFEGIPKNVVVYIHGGYWTQGVLMDCGGFLAHNVVGPDTIFVTFDYKLSPPNRMPQVVESILALSNHLEKLYSSSDLNYIGHSAGAHLAAMILLKSAPASKFLLVSGIFDLDPIKNSCVNQESKLDLSDADVAEFSPQKLFGDAQTENKNVVVVAGSFESPEFQRQTNEFGAKLKANTKIIEKFGHFDIIESLYYKDSELSGLLSGLIQT